MHWTETFFVRPFQQEYLEYVQDTERTAREADFLFEQLRLSSDSSVLDLACGSGRHVLALAPRVAHVTGVDLTDAFIAEAKKNAEASEVSNVEFVVQDMRALDYAERFDAAYNYFTAWGYYSDHENFDVLRRVRRALKPGGRFLLEMMSRDGLMRGYRPRDFSEEADGTVRLEERTFDLEQGRAFNRRVYLHPDGRREEVRFDHYMPTADMLIRHLVDAGFARARAVEAPSGLPLTINSWRMAVIGEV